MSKSGAVTLRVPADRLTREKVAIVGFTDHRVQALALDRSQWEVWGLNELHKQHDPALFDRWFEVHNRADLDGDADHIAALAKMDIPVYMQVHHKDIPASVPFPRQAILDRFDINYFTSSIAWEMALAILWGAKEIAIYGVDMATGTEYAQQRTCCEFWLGLARGMGIKTTVPPTADLLKTVGEYGFGTAGDAFSLKLKERKGWLHGQDNDFLTQLRGLEGQYHEIRRRLDVERADAEEDMEAAFFADVCAPDKTPEQVRELVVAHRRATRALGREHTSKLDKLEAEYTAKREPLFAQRNQVFGAILDCEYWEQSWSVPVSANREISPDRSKDPRTGIAPSAVAPSDSKSPPDADNLGVSSKKRVTKNRIAEQVAAA